MRRTRRVGLRALMEASKCDPSRLDEGDLGFRLAPRINAAGRLYRADAGVELLLTEDDDAGEADRRRARGGPTPSAARPSARSTRRPRRRGASCPRAEGSARAGARRRGMASRAWSGSSPRGWSSATTGPWSSSRWTATGRARLRPQHPRLRPARRAGGMLRAPGQLRRPPAPPPGCRCGPRTSRRSARRSPRTPASVLGRRTCGGPSASTRWSAAWGSASTSPKSSGSWRRSGWATPACGCWCPRRGSPTCGRWARRASTPASASTAAPTARRRRLRPLQPRRRDEDRSTPRCGSRSTTGTARSSPAWCCARSTRSRGRRRRALSPHPCDCEEAEWWARFEAELARDLRGQGGAVERTLACERKPPQQRRGSPRRVVRGAGHRRRRRSRSSCRAARGSSRSAADASRRAALANGVDGARPLQRRRGAGRLPSLRRRGGRRPRGPGRRRPGARRLRGARDGAPTSPPPSSTSSWSTPPARASKRRARLRPGRRRGHRQGGAPRGSPARR